MGLRHRVIEPLKSKCNRNSKIPPTKVGGFQNRGSRGKVEGAEKNGSATDEHGSLLALEFVSKFVLIFGWFQTVAG